METPATHCDTATPRRLRGCMVAVEIGSEPIAKSPALEEAFDCENWRKALPME